MYSIIRGCFFLLSLVPLRWGQRIGSVLGRIAFLAVRRHRQIAINNIAHSFDITPHQIKELANNVFENLGKILFEMAWSLRLKEKDFYRFFRIEGFSHIQTAYEKGKGVLVLTAHFGNWELLTVISAMIGYPLSIVYRRLDFKPMERFMVNYRTRFGGALIHKGSAMRKVLRSLNNRHMVALLMDQNVSPREGVFVNFLGRSACTNKGLALIALKTGIPVVPVFMIREKNGFRAVFLPEVPLIQTGDKLRDIEANTQQYNNIIESFIRTYPDQWFWVHQRWKTQNTS